MRGSTIGAIAAVAMAAVTAAACGDDLVLDGTGVRSGSRLRARHLVAGDARAFQGFHDRARDEDCAFTLRPGQASARCMPASTERNAFMDAACTVPAFYRGETSCELPTAYVHTRAFTACGGGIERIWRVGTLQRPAMVYALDGNGGCIAVAPGTGRVWYAATEEVPLDRFVRAELTDAVGGERLHERYLAGEDGSRITVAAFDTELGVPCIVQDAYGHLACHPDVSEGGWLWADSTCTLPIVERDDERFPVCAGEMAPYAAIWELGGACGYQRRIYEVGTAASTSGVHYGMGSSCSPDTGTERELYSLGAELPAEQLAAAERVDVGSGRIRTRMLVADGARAAEYGGLFDTEMGVHCTPQLMGDGAKRCVPSRGSIPTFYRDAQCGRTARFASIYRSCDEGWPDTPHVVDFEPPVVACGSDIARVYEVGAEVPSGSLYYLDGTTCLVMTWDREASRVYELGAEVPSDRFVRVDETTD